MRTDDVLKIKVVHADTAEEFERKINIVLENVKNPTIEWNHAKGFCAYVRYTEEVKTMDDIKDFFHNEGVYWHCRNCPYAEKTTDKRRKRVGCKIRSTGMTYKDSEACDFVYRQLLTGELTAEDMITEGGKA